MKFSWIDYRSCLTCKNHKICHLHIESKKMDVVLKNINMINYLMRICPPCCTNSCVLWCKVVFEFPLNSSQNESLKRQEKTKSISKRALDIMWSGLSSTVRPTYLCGDRKRHFNLKRGGGVIPITTCQWTSYKGNSARSTSPRIFQQLLREAIL